MDLVDRVVVFFGERSLRVLFLLVGHAQSVRWYFFLKRTDTWLVYCRLSRKGIFMLPHILLIQAAASSAWIFVSEIRISVDETENFSIFLKFALCMIKNQNFTRILYLLNVPFQYFSQTSKLIHISGILYIPFE